MTETKRCTKCKTEYPATPEFFHRSGSVGFYTQCKSCRNAAYRTLRATDESARARAISIGASYAYRLRLATLRIYCAGEPFCQCCGEAHLEFLSLDHVNNDGNTHRREIGAGGTALYRWAKKNSYPPSLQVLCSNCNWAKARYGECPHERERREGA
jgi:hypothetical protein